MTTAADTAPEAALIPPVVRAARIARRAGIAAMLSLSLAAPALAQDTTRSLTFRIPGGAFIPTGAQRALLKGAEVAAGQLAWRARPALAVTATVAWARSRDVSVADRPKLDVFTSDIGLEARSAERCARCAASATAFAGFGAGVRSLDYRKGAADATHRAAGYLAAGAEVGIRRVALRVEVRDYATSGSPLARVGGAGLHNDMAMMVSARFNRKAR